MICQVFLRRLNYFAGRYTLYIDGIRQDHVDGNDDIDEGIIFLKVSQRSSLETMFIKENSKATRQKLHGIYDRELTKAEID